MANVTKNSCIIARGDNHQITKANGYAILKSRLFIEASFELNVILDNLDFQRVIICCFVYIWCLEHLEKYKAKCVHKSSRITEYV